MPKTLKIYNGASDYDGSAGDSNLLYTIQGNLKDFRLTQNVSDTIDMFWAEVVDNSGYDIDVNDIWRLFSHTGALISSGYINKEPHRNENDNLERFGEGWSGILKRRCIRDWAFYTSGYGSRGGDGQTTLAIFQSLINTYFSDYDIAQYFTTSTSRIKCRIKGMSCYDAFHEVCRTNYDNNNKRHCFRIYESGTPFAGTDNSGVNNKATSMVDTTKNFVNLGIEAGCKIYNTTDSSSGAVTSISTTTNTNDTVNFVALSGGTDNDFDNGDSYRFATMKCVCPPYDTSTITATLTDSDIFMNTINIQKKSDFNYQNAYVFGKTGLVNFCPHDKDYWTETSETTAGGDWWGTTFWKDGSGGNMTCDEETGTTKAGSRCMKANCNTNNMDVNFYLDLDDVDCTGSGSQDYVEAALFTNGTGFIIDTSVEQRLHFWCYTGNAVGPSGGLQNLRVHIDEDRVDQGVDYNLEHNATTWTEYDLALTELSPSLADGNEVTRITWDSTTTGYDTNYYVLIDQIYFYTKYGQAKGSYTSAGNPARDLVIHDSSLYQDQQCDEVAEWVITNGQDHWEGSIDLIRENTDIFPGASIKIVLPSTNIGTNGTISQAPVQKIEWTPRGQRLYIGMNRTTNDIIAEASREVRMK